jgi:hypothetical protein
VSNDTGRRSRKEMHTIFRNKWPGTVTSLKGPPVSLLYSIYGEARLNLRERGVVAL